MIKTLESYFTTGYETDEARQEFFDMKMGDKDHEKESFADFAARFRSKAVLGKVTPTDWSYQLWDKITEQLRDATTSVKHTWGGDFDTMVVSLTSTDLECRRNAVSKLSATQRNPSYGPAVANAGAFRKTVPKPTRYASASTAPVPAMKSTSDRPKFSTSPIPPPQKKPFPSDGCFLCGKPGHLKKNCPDLPTIRALIQEIDETPETEDSSQEEGESELIREGNEEA